MKIKEKRIKKIEDGKEEHTSDSPRPMQRIALRPVSRNQEILDYYQMIQGERRRGRGREEDSGRERGTGRGGEGGGRGEDRGEREELSYQVDLHMFCYQRRCTGRTLIPKSVLIN